VRLTVIGASGSYPGPESPASCYLLEAEHQGRTWRVLVDLGSGALGVLQRHIDPVTVDAVLLSHLHADHCLDLCGFYVLRKYHPTGPQPRIPVWGPEGTAVRMAKAYDLAVLLEWLCRLWHQARLVGEPMTMDDGRVGHAELALSGGTLYLAEEFPEIGVVAPSPAGTPVSLSLQVPDVAETMRRLLVGASAMTLSVGWPDYEWDRLTEVLLYPQDFARDYGFEMKELSGQAHGWGTVILSAPALIDSFEHPDDGYHVGIHEFAHLVQVEQARFAEIPPGLDEEYGREWTELVAAEMDRIRRGKSVLDAYAGENPSEFLAVAVEAFFEIPLELRDRHREVYAILAAYFRQDPAAWDEARGL